MYEQVMNNDISSKDTIEVTQFYNDEICQYSPEVLYINGSDPNNFKLLIGLNLNPNQTTQEEYLSLLNTELKKLSFSLKILDDYGKEIYNYSTKPVNYTVSKERDFIDIDIPKKNLSEYMNIKYSFNYETSSQTMTGGSGEIQINPYRIEENQIVQDLTLYYQNFNDSRKQIQTSILQEKSSWSNTNLQVNKRVNEFLKISTDKFDSQIVGEITNNSLVRESLNNIINQNNISEKITDISVEFKNKNKAISNNGYDLKLEPTVKRINEKQITFNFDFYTKLNDKKVIVEEKTNASNLNKGLLLNPNIFDLNLVVNFKINGAPIKIKLPISDYKNYEIGNGFIYESVETWKPNNDNTYLLTKEDFWNKFSKLKYEEEFKELFDEVKI